MSDLRFDCFPYWCVGTVLSDTGVFSPLTVTPSPDILALKLQQVAAKTLPTGQSRLLQKAREQKDNSHRGKPVGGGSVKVSHKLIFQSYTSHVESHGGALSCSLYINRKIRMEWEMKGPTLRWSQHPLEPIPPLVMSLLPQATRSWLLPIKALTQRIKPARDQNTGVYGSSE